MSELAEFSFSDNFGSKKLIELLLKEFFSCSKNQERFLKEFPNWKQQKIHFKKVIQGSAPAKVIDSNSLARKRLVLECIEDISLLREISLIRDSKPDLGGGEITKKKMEKILNCFSPVDILWEIIAGRIKASKVASEMVMSRAMVDLENRFASKGEGKLKKPVRQKKTETEAALIKRLEKRNQQLEKEIKLVQRKSVGFQEDFKKAKKKIADFEVRLKEVSCERDILRGQIKDLERQLRNQEKQIRKYKEKIKEKKKEIKRLSLKCEVCQHKNKSITDGGDTDFAKDAFQFKGGSTSDVFRENKFKQEVERELAKEEAKKQLKRAYSRLRWLEQEIFKHGNPQRIIVDGHNLLLKGGFINCGDLAFEPRARERLINDMCDFAINVNCRTILVFDTKYDEHFVPNELLEVVYWPRKRGGADRYIIDVVDATNNGLVLIFSDDQNHIGREVKNLQAEGKSVYCFGVNLMRDYLVALGKLNQLKKVNGLSIGRSI